MNRTEFNQQLSAAAGEMSGAASAQDTLERAVQIAIDLIPHCDGVGISVAHVDGIDTPAASSEDLRKVDELQYALRQGPCFEAIRDDEPVTTSVDLATDERWPEWGPRVVDELGFQSTLSFLLYTIGERRGALNLYSRQLDGFSRDDIDHGVALASQLSVAYATFTHEDQFHAALASRTVIGQATGMIMERFGLDATAAFAVLTRISSRSNTKIVDLATELVRTGKTTQLN